MLTGQAGDPVPEQDLHELDQLLVSGVDVVEELLPGRDRITSYNVCYTKLLRLKKCCF